MAKLPAPKVVRAAGVRGSVTTIYVDGDACPVREEVYRVADRMALQVVLVANGSRPIRPTGRPNVAMVTVPAGPDVADDYIAEHITAADCCVTGDIPLAARCLEKGARAIAPTGHIWTPDNIGSALAGRELSRHLRELGVGGGGPPPLTKTERSKFLGGLDTVLQALRRAR
jgi:uncharacterized protein YaiI (UPF0178 family)